MDLPPGCRLSVEKHPSWANREFVDEAERRAIDFGCHSADVDTFSFQEPDFYPRFGYEVFGTLDYPRDNKRIFFRNGSSPRRVDMPMRLGGSCRCGAVSFTVDSNTPYPYQRCYCSICRKSAGGGGYAINIMGIAETLQVRGKRALGVWNAPIDGRKGSADRYYCKKCGTPLWVSDESWPELMHPFASAIDTELPKTPKSVHLLLRDKADWVEPQIGPDDDCFDLYPELSIEDWHKKNGLWIE